MIRPSDMTAEHRHAAVSALRWDAVASGHFEPHRSLHSSIQIIERVFVCAAGLLLIDTDRGARQLYACMYVSFDSFTHSFARADPTQCASRRRLALSACMRG